MTEERKRIHGVEIFLDNRQVFLLFFASAVVLSLVFTLGVVVGKRVETTTSSPVTDPLTLLDQMGGNQVDDNLTFHEALTGEKAGPGTDAGPSQAEPKSAEPPPPPKPESKPNPKPATAVARAEPEAKPEAKPEKAKPAPKLATVKKGEGKKKVDKKVDEEPEETPAEGYTLQLSSFQDRHEAELFMQKLREGGMQPYMEPTTIPGRGVWYRVRLGNYTSWDEALSAKQVFERQQKIIAYVAKK